MILQNFTADYLLVKIFFFSLSLSLYIYIYIYVHFSLLGNSALRFSVILFHIYARVFRLIEKYYIKDFTGVQCIRESTSRELTFF